METTRGSENTSQVDNDSHTDVAPTSDEENHAHLQQQGNNGLAHIDVLEGRGESLIYRALRPIHIFMITISAVLGIGLYVRSGMVLRLAGPVAVLLSFSIDGLLAWAVMQCIAEMVCLWPIPGALTQYVKVFVDAELGIVTGVVYWFTYAISFPALIAASAEEAQLWAPGKGIQGGVLFFLVPSALVIMNAFGVKTYGLFEVIGGTAKILFLATAIVIMGAINGGAGPNHAIGRSNYQSSTASLFGYDKEAANSWTQAFLASMSITAFAFVGVEVVAACALEARPSTRTTRTTNNNVNQTIKFSAVYLPSLAAAVYVLAGFLVTLDVSATDSNLPQVSWGGGEASHSSTDSAFVLAALKSRIPALKDVINVFILMTAITCANTNLYVASRTLFGLTRELEQGSGQPWYVNMLASLGTTNDRRVPMRAMLASCVFLWTPFLLFIKGDGPGIKIIDILSEMASVGVVMVWACQCWAFIRFYHALQKHETKLKSIGLVQRTRSTSADYYPYRSHGQPFVAYGALAGCIFILLVANSASLWKEFHVHAFLSAFLAPICFLALLVFLKTYRGSSFELENLDDPEIFRMKIEDLIRLRDQTFDNSNASHSTES